MEEALTNRKILICERPSRGQYPMRIALVGTDENVNVARRTRHGVCCYGIGPDREEIRVLLAERLQGDPGRSAEFAASHLAA
jgi:hypothetical protein